MAKYDKDFIEFVIENYEMDLVEQEKLNLNTNVEYCERMLDFLKKSDKDRERDEYSDLAEALANDYLLYLELHGLESSVTIEDDLDRGGSVMDKDLENLRSKLKVDSEDTKMKKLGEDAFVGEDIPVDKVLKHSTYDGSPEGWGSEPFTSQYHNNFTTTGLKKVAKDHRLLAGVLGAVSVLGVILVVYKIIKNRDN